MDAGGILRAVRSVDVVARVAVAEARQVQRASTRTTAGDRATEARDVAQEEVIMMKSFNPCSACGGSTGRHCVCQSQTWRWCQACARLTSGNCGVHGVRTFEIGGTR